MSHLPIPNLDVGKYAGFVWPAYGLSALVLLGMLADSLLRARRWRRAAEVQDKDAQ
jgi:heme exporter protein D